MTMKWKTRKVTVIPKEKKRKIKSKVKPKKCKRSSPDSQKDTSSDEQSSPVVKNKRKMIGKQKGGKAGKPGKPSVSDLDVIPTIAKKGIVTCPEAQWTMLMEYVQ